jgi:hypothetical protein
MSVGSLLWINGKRKLLSKFTKYFTALNPIISDLHSGIRQEHPLVRYLQTLVAGTGTHNESMTKKLGNHKTHYFVA